jgi:hypothetical protein
MRDRCGYPRDAGFWRVARWTVLAWPVEHHGHLAVVQRISSSSTAQPFRLIEEKRDQEKRQELKRWFHWN